MNRKRKIDITLTVFSMKSIDRDGNIKHLQGSLIGKYSDREVLKDFNKSHSKFIYTEIENIDYIKNHYEVNLWDLYDFCEEHQI